MATYKKGTDTGFQDANGVPILVGDRLTSTSTGVIGHIDKWKNFSSPFGIKSSLKKLDLRTFVHYNGPEPEAPAGEVVTAEDVAQVTPPKGRRQAEPAKQDAEPAPVEPRDISLKSYGTEALCMELTRRGYKVQLVFLKS